MKIDTVLICASCAQRFRSIEPASALSRSCICGGGLRVDRRETLRAAVRESGAPLEAIVDAVSQLPR
jgi:hypothetical protein